MTSKTKLQLRVFFAIPCGSFYATQAAVIKDVCKSLCIDAAIAEDDPSTKGLWQKVQDDIDRSDFFVADISSASPNTLLELGYAIARKPVSRIGLFIAQSVPVPSDLLWLVVQPYGSFRGFREQLYKWLSNILPWPVGRDSLPRKGKAFAFMEDFLNQETFLRRWTTPPGCAFLFTPEGLRFTDAHFPILTNCLAILRDYEFEFDCRIEDRQIGWVVKGTIAYRDLLPSFCIMFTLNTDGFLTPHIWARDKPHPGTHYHVFKKQTVHTKIKWARDGSFTLATRVLGDSVEVIHGGKRILKADFTKQRYRDLYDSVLNKQGQIGFRCHPSEVAIVGRVRIKEL